MARVYEHPEESELDLEGSSIKSFDPITRRALIKFWISSLGIIVAAVVLYILSRKVILPGAALIAAMITAAIALGLLFMMNRSLRKMHVMSKKEAKIDRRIEQVLEQLDDRFAVFNRVRVEDTFVDHVLVGPTGTYAVKSSATLDKDGWARSGDIAQVLEERNALQGLHRQLMPDSGTVIEPVLCVPAGSTVKVGQEETGVWIVPAEKMATALIKRSGQDGAIGKNVNETGAFSSDTLQSAAIERAFANHWKIPTRKTRGDFAPPPGLTGEELTS